MKLGGSKKSSTMFRSGSLQILIAILVVLSATVWSPASIAHAAGTPAGTMISNKATVRYTMGSNTFTQDSNTDTITVVSGATVNINKTAVVSDVFGGSQPITGSTIRYTLTVTAAGSGTAVGVVISDPIPPITTYTSGTLRLNGISLSDGVDADAGDVGGTTAGTVTVRLGDLTSASPAQTITFDVKIN